MNLQKRALMVAAASGLLIGASLGLGDAALADPPEGGNASCWGYEAADVSPPGSEDGVFSQHGMPGILAFTDIGVEVLGLKNRGGVVSAFANAHEGSHEACDAFFNVPPEE